MEVSGFERLKRIADLVRNHSAPVPIAQQDVEYWHGAAFEVLGTRCVTGLRETRKVVDLTPTISIPGAKHWVRGIANIGGRILSIADLSAFLSKGETASKGTQALVISGRGIHTGLVIDASFGGVRFAADSLRTDQQVHEKLQPFISGVFNSDEGDYAVFSIEKLLNDISFTQAGISND
jgi:twitching motility protein PilI